MGSRSAARNNGKRSDALIAARALDAVFERAKAERRCAVVPYVVAGDPDLATTEAILDTLAALRVDAMELGIPYGDPLADGRTIATAAYRALSAGTTMRDVLAMASRAQARGWPAILYFTYVNPVDRFGIERFADAVAESGAAGGIVPDVPLEETSELRDAFAARGLALPLLVAPTTPLDRARRIVRASTGFVYVVSRLGVTSAHRAPDFQATAARVAELRSAASVPLCVGFGISSADDVRKVTAFADGAIVGSALIDAYAGKRGADAAKAVRSFIEPLMEAARWE